MITVPRLARGKGYKGPEYFGCCNTGTAPCIFRSLTGKWVVGPEIPCRNALRAGLPLFAHVRVAGTGRDRVWIYKSRQAAVAKFHVLAEAREKQNAEMRRECDELAHRAASGDLDAALSLSNY